MTRMSLIKRLAAVLLISCLLAYIPSAFAKTKSTPTPPPPEVPEDILQEIPAQIRDVLDLAYAELLDVNGQELKTKNKYTKWRNNYEWGWCGGFITWCMLENEIPMFDQGKAPKEEVPGLIHMKAAGVGKIYTGYERMNRITNIPQKGFIAVFGNANSKYVKAGSTPYYHVGLVYDVIQLPNGLYRITTIEGNVSVNFSDTDGVRHKAGHTVRMYTRDYNPNTEKPKDDLTLVPEEERTREESITFSYDYTYNNPSMYITCFMMPWVPGDPTLDLVPADADQPSP